MTDAKKAMPIHTMNVRRIMRYDPTTRMVRLFRLVYQRGTVGDGTGYSCKISAAFQPRMFQWIGHRDEWFLTTLGVRVHYQRSYGNVHV